MASATLSCGGKRKTKSGREVWHQGHGDEDQDGSWVEERVTGFGGGFGARGDEAGAGCVSGGGEEVDGEPEGGGLGEAMCQALQCWGGRVQESCRQVFGREGWHGRWGWAGQESHVEGAEMEAGGE